MVMFGSQELNAACFLWDARFNKRARVVNSLLRLVFPPEGVLQTNEWLTVPCTHHSPVGFASGPPRLTYADLAISVLGPL